MANICRKGNELAITSNLGKVIEFAKSKYSNVSNNTVFVHTIGHTIADCPVCGSCLSENDKAYRRCINCLSYLRYHYEEVKHIIEARDPNKLYNMDLKHNPIVFVWYYKSKILNMIAIKS